MDSELVSIVVPVYNAEKFLRRCIDSILKQSYKNIELILINDGSTDGSSKICDMYSRKDSRVKVIHQKNAGQSVARNVGIENAKGKYIQFVDSDDFIEANMTKNLVDEIKKNVDIVICGFKLIYKENDVNMFVENNYYKKEQISKSDFLKIFGKLFLKNYLNSVWNKLYITDVIKKNKIMFKTTMTLGEDLVFNLEYLDHCKKISIVDKSLYNYIKYNSNSITSIFYDKLFEDLKYMFKTVINFLKKNNYYLSENKKIVELKFTNSIIVYIDKLICMNIGKNKLKDKVNEIIDDVMIKENLNYFYNGSLQEKLIGIAIRNKWRNSIIFYFKIKKFLRNNLNFLHEILRGINNYTKRKFV